MEYFFNYAIKFKHLIYKIRYFTNAVIVFSIIVEVELVLLGIKINKNPWIAEIDLDKINLILSIKLSSLNLIDLINSTIRN